MCVQKIIGNIIKLFWTYYNNIVWDYNNENISVYYECKFSVYNQKSRNVYIYICVRVCVCLCVCKRDVDKTFGQRVCICGCKYVAPLTPLTSLVPELTDGFHVWLSTYRQSKVLAWIYPSVCVNMCVCVSVWRWGQTAHQSCQNYAVDV